MIALGLILIHLLLGIITLYMVLWYDRDITSNIEVIEAFRIVLLGVLSFIAITLGILSESNIFNKCRTKFKSMFNRTMKNPFYK